LHYIAKSFRRDEMFAPLDTHPDLHYIVVNMSQPSTLGEFEHLVMLAILRLDDNAYGVAIRAEIEKCAEQSVTPGALYTTLDRLTQKGWVDSQVGDPTPIRGGRAKRYYKVTAAGIAAVKASHRALQTMAAGLKIFEAAHA
jgi:DNA-binding PadR family transcriptional regulator